MVEEFKYWVGNYSRTIPAVHLVHDMTIQIAKVMNKR